MWYVSIASATKHFSNVFARIFSSLLSHFDFVVLMDSVGWTLYEKL